MVHDAISFQTLFNVDCHSASCPIFALGHRWLAYNLPPQQVLTPHGGNLLGGGPKFPSIVRDGIQYLGQVSQRTLDHMWMPGEGTELGPVLTTPQCGVVAVRDAVTRTIIGRLEDHHEAIEMMIWDPSGLQLITCAAQGHRVFVHRALLGEEQALMLHDGTSIALGSVVFQHLFTLVRGYTPAVISDMTVSDDGQLIGVSSAKGTAHVFQLPPLMSTTADIARKSPIQLSPRTRVKLGSMLLPEELKPKCGLLGPTPSGKNLEPRLFVVSRAGTLALYSMSPSSAGMPRGSNSTPPHVGAACATTKSTEGDWQAVLTKEVSVCRPHRERRMVPQDASRVCSGAQFASGAGRSISFSSMPNSQTLDNASTWGTVCSPWASPAHSPASPPLGLASRLGSDDAGETWLSQVETKTHVLVQVPIWHCPMLSFYMHPTSTTCDELDNVVRQGKAGSGRVLVAVSPPQQDHDGCVNSIAIEGALNAAVFESPCRRMGDAPLVVPASPVTSAIPKAGGTIQVAPAWESISIGQHAGTFGGLDHVDVVGSGLDHIEDDWIAVGNGGSQHPT